MQTFETTDPKIARRCRYGQHRSHQHIALSRWHERLPKCIGLNHHLVKEIKVRALKRARISKPTRADMQASIMRAWHFGQAGRRISRLTLSGKKWDFCMMLPSSRRRERNTLCHWSVPVAWRGDKKTLGFGVSRGCFILISLRSAMKLC
jgi:hypothetical protein